GVTSACTAVRATTSWRSAISAISRMIACSCRRAGKPKRFGSLSSPPRATESAAIGRSGARGVGGGGSAARAGDLCCVCRAGVCGRDGDCEVGGSARYLVSGHGHEDVQRTLLRVPELIATPGHDCERPLEG